MRETFTANIPLGLSQVFSSSGPDCCTLPCNTGTEEKNKRGNSLHSWNAHSCLRQPRGPTRLRATVFCSQMKMQLEVGQETSFMSPNHRLHACLHHPIHPGLKSGRHHLGEPTMALPMHKLCCPWAKGRQGLWVPAYKRSLYAWELLSLAGSRTCKVTAMKPEIHIYAKQATNFPPWWKHNEENLSDRFTAGFNLQPKHI